MLIEGGIRMPSVPPRGDRAEKQPLRVAPLFDLAQRHRADGRGGRHARCRTWPANMAQAAMLECIRPPGSHGIQSTSALYIRSAMPERSRISPSRTKNGIATSRKLFDVAQADLADGERQRQLRIEG